MEGARQGSRETKEVSETVGDEGRTERRAGLEQEFFLVDAEGRPSEGADDFLRACRESSGRTGFAAKA